MVLNAKMIAGLTVCTALALTGCDKQEEAAAPTIPTATATEAKTAVSESQAKADATAAQAKADAAAAQAKADAAAAQAKADTAAAQAKADAAAAQAKADTAAAQAKADTAAAQAKADAAAAQAKADAAAASEDTITKAKTMLADAIKFIKDKKLDEAGLKLLELSKIKDSLPAPLQKQITDAQNAHEAAKAADTVKGLFN